MSATPTKICKRGRKAKAGKQNKNFRFCGTNFEAAGKRVSLQNLFLPTLREESPGLILAECCSTMGLSVTKNPNLSERVCIPCSHKIRNAAELYQRESRERSKSLKSEAMNGKLLLERLIRGSPCFPKQEIIDDLIPRAQKSPAAAHYQNKKLTAFRQVFVMWMTLRKKQKPR